MPPNLPHERSDSSPSFSNNEEDNSNVSSVESLRKATPKTPPQVRLNLDPVAIQGSPAFSDFFPWMHQSGPQDDQVQGSDKLSEAPYTSGTTLIESRRGTVDSDSIALFQQRDATHLNRTSLLLPAGPIDVPATSLGIFQPLDEVSTDSSEQNALPLSSSLLPAPSIQQDHSSASMPFTSGVDPLTVVELSSRESSVEHHPVLYPSTDLRRRRASKPSSERPVSGSFQTAPTFSPRSGLSAQAPSLPQSPEPQRAVPSMHTRSPRFADQPASETTSAPLMDERTQENQVLDIFEDDKIPGYLVRSRESTASNSTIVRIPRQLVGWKAVLMETESSFDALLSTADMSKKARRASKVLGKQGWEVRQEALKNSYDFRMGSGIWATMHAGHRLFKHDWHIIVKDGSRYMWRMDKQALALYREGDDVKVAEFCKAVPSSSAGEARNETVSSGLDISKRIGSFRYDTPSPSTSTGSEAVSVIFDINLALASLIAIFGARGGHKSVSAAFEASSDPLRKVLERRRQETPDREEVMLALPRPGFARDAESIMSDTTDEDADPRSSDTLSRRPAQSKPNVRRSPLPSQTHRRGMSAVPLQTYGSVDPFDSTAARAPASGGRKRFSSFFGKGNAPIGINEEQEKENVPTGRASNDRTMTDAQRIARKYRTQSMVFG